MSKKMTPVELDVSRRKFLKNTGIVAGVAALSGAVITAGGAGVLAADNATAAHAAVKPVAKMFFTNQREFSTLSAAAERIFPKDDTGPGAIDLGVPYFIDNQLAGAYGYNAREYTQGPFAPGAPTQGYQTALLKKDIFIQGIAALNKQANTSFQADFPDIEDEQQDQVLKMCEAGNIPMDGVTSSYFFAILKGAVLAGVYADPIYNGNNNMDGWKMKDYPGAQMTYTKIIDSKKFEKIAPMSLADMQHLMH